MPVSYFKHTVNTRNDQRLCDVGDDMQDNNLAYALFHKTKELMAERQEHNLLLSKCEANAYYCRTTQELLKRFYTFAFERGLLQLDGDIIHLPSFSLECKTIEATSVARAESGQKGGLASHLGKSDSPTKPTNPAKPTKPKSERAEKPNYQSILDHWNSKQIVIHKVLTSDIKKAIEKRLKEYTLADICDAINRYKNAVSTVDFWIGRSKEWTLALFLSRDNGMPKFLTWETKTTPEGGTGNNDAPFGRWTQKEIDEIISTNAARVKMGFGDKNGKVPEVGDAKKY